LCRLLEGSTGNVDGIAVQQGSTDDGVAVQKEVLIMMVLLFRSKYDDGVAVQKVVLMLMLYRS